MMLNCPRFERPREKAIYNGIETLSNQELIAVILRTGNKEMSVLNLASLLLEEIGGFQALKDVDYYQLTKIKGIKQAKAIELMASIELAKRMQKENTKRFVIKEPQDGYEYIKHKLMFEKQEKVILLCLNSRLEIIQEKLLFIGSGDASMLETKEVFQHTLRCGANRIILIHNHPSGNVMPSPGDIIATRKLHAAMETIDVHLQDHIIFGYPDYLSMKDCGLLAHILKPDNQMIQTEEGEQYNSKIIKIKTPFGKGQVKSTRLAFYESKRKSKNKQD